MAYHECLTKAYEALRSYVQSSEVLLTAAHKVSELYASADQLSAARAEEIEAALKAATGEVLTARTATGAADEAARAAEAAAREVAR